MALSRPELVLAFPNLLAGQAEHYGRDRCSRNYYLADIVA